MTTTQPFLMAAVAASRLAVSDGKVKAMLALGVIEDDKSILGLAKNIGDQRQSEGLLLQWAGIPLENATNYQNWL